MKKLENGSLPEYQPEDHAGEFQIYICFFAVGFADSCLRIHGNWQDKEQAQKVADAIPGPAKVINVAPYWYMPAFGKVG